MRSLMPKEALKESLSTTEVNQTSEMDGSAPSGA